MLSCLDMPKRHDITALEVERARVRQFTEEFGLMGERSGMPRMVARLLGWLLICDPPSQSSTEIASALGVSRASVSIATRLLEAGGLIRRTALAGTRGHPFEVE